MLEEINHQTPYIVIQEIIRCNGSDLEITDIEKNFNIISDHLKIYDYEVETDDEYDDDTLDRISLFVSQKETNWDEKNLIKAFNSIIEYDNIIDENFTFGPKTNERAHMF